MESVATGESKLSPSAASKKMKQTRLPFQVLSGSPTPAAIAPLAASPTSLRTPSESRKRKPSIESSVAVDALRAAKIGRTSEAKENVKDVGPPPVILLDDDSVPGGGVDDEGSNSRDLVDVRKDGKLVKVSTPRTPQRDGGDGGGEGTSDRKIRIKLPMASKKRKSVGAKDGSEKKKKKAAKEKRKGKKGVGVKEGKVGVEIAADEEPIAIDDSDLSEDEKEDEKTEEKSKESDEQPKVEENAEEKSKEAQEVAQEPSKDQENVEKEESATVDKDSIEETQAKSEEKVEKPAEKPSETEKSEVTSRRSRGRLSRASKEESEKKKSPKPKRSPAKAAKATKSETSEEVKETVEKVTVQDDTEAKASKEVEEDAEPSSKDVSTEKPEEVKDQPEESPKTSEVESSSQAKTEGETKEQAKPTEDEAKPEQETKQQTVKEAKTEGETNEQAKPTENEAKPEQETKQQTVKEAKTHSVTDSNNKRTRYSRAASAKKSEGSEETPKKESTPEDKKSSSAKGALDKFFAKVQNGSTEEKKPKIVVTEDSPERMEVEAAESRSNNNNSTIASICLDDSDDGENTADAEENAYMLCTPNSKDRTALSGATDNRKLTPKQMARKMEAEKRLAMKQQELEDRKRKKIEEKEAKQKEREEQERLRKKEKEEKEEQKRKEREEKEEAKRKEREEKEEQKRKEKEEKDEQKRKEREEKEKKRQAELDAKNEEKRKKDEQREEERRKKEEEKEAEEKRKQKTAQAFQSFFVKKANGSGGSKHSDDENSMESSGEDHQLQQPQQQAFMPFCVKGDMRLAPTCRATLPKDRKQRLEELLRKSSDEQGKQAVVVEDRDELYLGQLKSAQYQVGTMDRTWIAEEEDGAADDDVMIVDDDVCHQIEEDRTAVPSKRYRAKYFLFEENRRPPYRGTWRKKSEKIRPRRPLVQDTKFFDYEVDSDDEWEEEEPGESLHGSDDEKDVDKEEEDYEVDNDFFVPHGHLSDEELQAEDDIADDNSPEAQKAKLKIMQQEFAAEMKKKTEKIKPRLIGCLWENGSGNERSECSAVIWEILKARAMLFDPEEPISFTTVRNEPDSNSCSPSKPGEASAQTERVPKAKMVKLADEGVRELITLIHGCAKNRSFLVKEFLAYWGKRRDDGEKVPQFAPDSIRTKILEISSWRPCPDEGPMQNKMCWYVNKEALVRYELTDLKVPTGWNFILKPIVKSKKERKDKEKDAEGGGGEGEEGGEEKKTPPRKKKSKEVNGEEKEKKDRPSTSTPSSSSKAKPAAGTAITKFTKKLSEDEKRKQFAKERKKSVGGEATTNHNKTSETKPSTSAKKQTPTASPAANSTEPKKRVQLLMSVPRGQAIPQTTKNNLISQFLAKKPAAAVTEPEDAGSSSSSNKSTGQERMDVDEVVVLDD
uniref:Putative chromatin assembly factor 1 subunit a n=1 Tax=Culex tarsalis TaxID=7177 RepID=A0A1Q3EWD0_CULTA